MKCIGSPVAEIWPFVYLKGHMEPYFGETEVAGGQRWHHSKERWGFLKALHCDVTVALSVTVRPQFVIECLRTSNQQGVGKFGPKFSVIPLGVDP